MKTTANFFTLFFAAFLLIASVGCNKGAVDGLNIPDPGSGTGGGVLPGTADGVAGDNYFYVGVDKTVNSIAHVHNATGFNEPCSIIDTTTSTQDIVCIVDIPESSLFYNGIKFKVNQPASMCQSMGYFPYWYYNEEVGKGPTSINITRTKTVVASGDVTWGATIDCTVGNDGGAGVADPNCASQDEINTVYDPTTGDVSVSCKYDHTGEEDKHNCCLGQYQYIVSTAESNDQTLFNGTTSTAPELKEWGGNLQSCIGGPGRGWSHLDKDDYPIREIVQNPDPTLPNKKEYIVFPPETLIQFDSTKEWSVNRPAANYFTNGSHTHDGYNTLTSSVYPYFVDPIDDRSGSTMVSGNPTYSFTCLDPAYENKHRISVYVREWDSYIDYLLYISSSGTSGTPDRFANESPGSTTCDGVGGPCDDFHDADDFLINESLPGTYDTAAKANRYQNFPYDVYK